jgi:hypothetical protein
MSRKFTIEKSFFDKEILDVDPKTKEPLSWPYENQEQKDYNDWLSKVKDPITGQFYKKTDTEIDYDDEGKEIPESKKVIEKEPFFKRTQIVRLRTKEGKEFLYSRGQITAYTALGSISTTSFQEPEIWKQTLFKRHVAYNEREQRHKEIIDGPSGFIMHYTLPFNETNVDKLMKDAAPNIKLYVKEEGKNQSKDCPDLQMFKTKSIDYILNDEWQTVEEKEKAIKEYEAMEKNIISKRKQM